MNPTRAIGDWVAGLTDDAIPSAVRGLAKDAFLDTIGVALAGSGDPAVAIASRLLDEECPKPEATRIGGGARTSIEGAALVNGIAAHILDFDDYSPSMHGHPSAVLVPAALAVAEAAGRSGRDLITGYVAGLEVGALVGAAAGPRHYPAWHGTSTLGALAAAAAAAKLLGLTAGQVACALSIAASLASGLRQNFGSMTKSLHAGHAARCGIQAARLARAGYTADEHALDGPTGFLAAFGLGADRPELLSRPLGTTWELAQPGLPTKKFACCFGTHRAIDGALGLVREHRLVARDVAAVEIGATPPELGSLRAELPVNGLEAKFSMAYVIAAALADGTVTMASFDDRMVRRPEIADLMPRIVSRAYTRESGEPLGMNEGVARVACRLHDGRTLRTEVRLPRGTPPLWLTPDERLAKFLDCAGVVLPASRAAALADRILTLDELDDTAMLTASLAA